jgi:hypothetical protein
VSFHFIHPNHKVFKEAIMAKKVIRLGILLVLVLSFMFGAVGIKNAYAAKSTKSNNSIGYVFNLFILDWVWNGNLDTTTWPPPPGSVTRMWLPGTTIGQVKADMSASLGYSVVVFTATDGSCNTNSQFWFQPGDSEIVDNYSCGGGFLSTFAVFKAQHKVEVTRLTLYGYSLGDGKSCVLWSLDGNPNGNPTKKCGAEAELVCKVRLVEKDLKYACKDGYDWLGFQIAHDPQWLSWADKFARQHDR